LFAIIDFFSRSKTSASVRFWETAPIRAAAVLGLLSFRYKQKTQAERKIISLKPVPPSCERGKIAEKG